MRKLINGIVDFQENVLPTCSDTFARLAYRQSPDALFIACSDSRVVPNLFASTDPGDLFVIRNVANLIPPCDPSGMTCCAGSSEAAALEFSLEQLNVSDIIICGHSNCGGAEALLDESRLLSPNLRSWLRYGLPSVARLCAGEILDSSLSQVDQLSQINVLQQVDHLRTYPVVKKAVIKGRVRLHAWWFDIATAGVYVYCPDLIRFVLIDREKAVNLLSLLES